MSTGYRFDFANIDVDPLDAHAVAQTFAARWQFELTFKELNLTIASMNCPPAMRTSSRPC